MHVASSKSVAKIVSPLCRSTTGAALQEFSLHEALRQIRITSGQNATVVVRVKLNLDPRLNGQKLKGFFEYAHSTGKGCPVVVHTLDGRLADAAVRSGASFAGDIVDRITNDEIRYPRDFEKIITTTDFEHAVVHKKLLYERMKRGESTNRVILNDDNWSELPKILRSLRIVPSLSDRTLLTNHDDVLASVRGYVQGSLVGYATDSDGNLSTRIGKLTMADTTLSENLYTMLKHLLDTRPVQFGTGHRAKRSNRGKYVLGLHLVSSSRIDPVRLDLSSLAPLNEKSHRMPQAIHGLGDKG